MNIIGKMEKDEDNDLKGEDACGIEEDDDEDSKKDAPGRRKRRWIRNYKITQDICLTSSTTT